VCVRFLNVNLWQEMYSKYAEAPFNTTWSTLRVSLHLPTTCLTLAVLFATTESAFSTREGVLS